jgi:hypothetical protein
LILNTGLNDKDPDIRFYAASALILLNDSFISEFRDIQKRINEEPDNPQHHLNLATAYDRYCSWNLPEEEDMDGYRGKMEVSYRTAWNIAPENINAMIGLSKALISKSDYIAASDILYRGIRQYPESSILALQNLILLYHKKDYKNLQQQSQLYISRFPNSALEIQEAISFWTDSRQSAIYYEHYIP